MPRARGAMIATPHHLATDAGARLLQRGGSAVDALIGANAVLAVVYPHMAGLGGDGFWLLHHPDAGLRAVDAAGPSARNATLDRYQSGIPLRGGAAALTVPGAVDGWRRAHEAYGRLPWGDLFRDAHRLARDGVPVSRSLAKWTRHAAADLAHDPATSRLFQSALETGTLRQPDLARTLETLAGAGARQGFYEGDTAHALAAALDAAGSPLRAEDLAAYEAAWVDPLRTRYRNVTVAELPPPTQGHAALQILRMLEGYDVAAWDPDGPEYYHHAVEAVKLAFADRDAHLTDPAFHDVPLDRLLSTPYATERRARIDPAHATPALDVRTGVPGGDTCAFSAVDADGLAASCIQSVYHEFGAAFLVGATGILPQNRGTAFHLDPGHPNRLEPGKRPAHTLIPAMLLQDDRPWVAFGSMGGDGQPQTHAALVTRLVDHDLPLQAAVNAPRWIQGRTWGATRARLLLEARIPEDTIHDLRARGHPIEIGDAWDERLGHAQAIRIHADGSLEGAADPRGDGSVRHVPR